MQYRCEPGIERSAEPASVLVGRVFARYPRKQQTVVSSRGGVAGNGRSNLTWRLGKCNLGRN